MITFNVRDGDYCFKQRTYLEFIRLLYHTDFLVKETLLRVFYRSTPQLLLDILLLFQLNIFQRGLANSLLPLPHIIPGLLYFPILINNSFSLKTPISFIHHTSLVF